MGSNTPNLNLYKPTGSEFVDEGTQLNDNWDKIDLLDPRIDSLETRVDTIEVSGLGSPPFGILARTADTEQTITTTGAYVAFDSMTMQHGGFTFDTSVPAKPALVVPSDGLYYCRFKVFVVSTAVSGNLTWYLMEIDAASEGQLTSIQPIVSAGWTPGYIDGYKSMHAGDKIGVRWTQNSGNNTAIRIGASNVTGNFEGSGAVANEGFSAELSLLYTGPLP